MPWSVGDDSSNTYQAPPTGSWPVTICINGGSSDQTVEVTVRDSSGNVVATCSLTAAEPCCNVTIPGGGEVEFEDGPDADSDGVAGTVVKQ